jgi:Coenzyme PQQ synthesis protein D (PqqD)
MSIKNSPPSQATRIDITDATVISRSPSVLAAEVEGAIMMMSINQSKYFSLDKIGSDIWQRIEPRCSFANLIDRLAVDYDADRAIIAADVRVLLDRMVAQDIVTLT